MKNRKDKPIAILEQFNERGKKFTYTYSFFGEGYGGILPYAYCIFKVYRKYKRTWWEKLFPYFEKRRIGKRFISSQINQVF